MADNPYAPPSTRTTDVAAPLPDGDFLPEGRGVPAGRGWGWLAEAWALMTGQLLTFIGIFVLFLVIQFGANVVPLIGPIAANLIAPLLLGGVFLGCDEVRRGGSIEVRHLFAGFQRHAGKLLVLGALTLAFAIVALIIVFIIVGAAFLPVLLSGVEPSPDQVAGMLLPMLLAGCVILLLSVPLSMAMLFATPLIVLADYDVGRALKTSFSVCLKNIVPFLVWSLVVLVLAIVAMIPLGLGWLLLGPVLMVSLYVAYRDIFYRS